MMKREFNREEHVYSSDAFEEIIKDTMRFFNGTPIVALPPPEKFQGTGVYAIYFTGKNPVYEEVAKRNRVEFSQPIYVGKAVSLGWRQARNATSKGKSSFELYRRLNEHSRSIEQATNLDLSDFSCRFMILEDAASSLIGTVEAALIRHYLPIWNAEIDGFGNHDPGKGRYNQAKSEWDLLHPGRPWADKCLGVTDTPNQVKERALRYYTK
jgi:hypothetical protein